METPYSPRITPEGKYVEPQAGGRREAHEGPAAKAKQATSNMQHTMADQARQRPWMALGLAIAAGYALGNMGGSRTRRRQRAIRRAYEQERRPLGRAYEHGQALHGVDLPEGRMDEERRRYETRRASARATEQATAGRTSRDERGYAYERHDEPGMLDELQAQLGDELSTLATALASASVHWVRDQLSENLPHFDEAYEQEQSKHGHGRHEHDADEQLMATP